MIQFKCWFYRNWPFYTKYRLALGNDFYKYKLGQIIPTGLLPILDRRDGIYCGKDIIVLI